MKRPSVLLDVMGRGKIAPIDCPETFIIISQQISGNIHKIAGFNFTAAKA
jgi:hypothetical protein